MHPLHPIRPLRRPNPQAIARKRAIRARILETLGAAGVGVVLVLILSL